MSKQAWAGYKARVESVGIARTQPLNSFKLLWKARQLGAMSTLGMVRQSIQNLAPRAYRRLVDQYVARRGTSNEQLQSIMNNHDSR
jgi:hypothetical protein